MGINDCIREIIYFSTENQHGSAAPDLQQKGTLKLSKALCSFLRSLLGDLNYGLSRDTSYNTKTKEVYLRQTEVSTGRPCRCRAGAEGFGPVGGL